MTVTQVLCVYNGSPHNIKLINIITIIKYKQKFDKKLLSCRLKRKYLNLIYGRQKLHK